MGDFASNNASAIALVLAGLCLLVIVMIQSLQVSGLKRRINALTGGAEEGDLESVLGQHLATVHQVGRDLDELTARTAILESSARHHFAREGLVRFNPFPDTGGNQSFALALLDESENGFIISSLHSRTGTRIYAKAVTGGKADTSLSAEEQEAIDEARSKRPARPATPPRSAAASRPVPGPSAAPADVAAAPRIAPGAAAAQAPRSVPAPMPAARTSTAPAGRAAPASAAKAPPAARVAPAAPSDEAANRPTSERAKGQEKPKNLSAADVASADSEKMDRKPGQPPVSAPRSR